MLPHDVKRQEMIYKLVSSSMRILIIRYILSLDEDAEYTKICQQVPRQQPTVSSHLKELRQMGILESYSVGLYGFYRFKSEQIRETVKKILVDLEHLATLL